MFAIKLHEKVRSIRKTKGIRQNHVAKQLGISNSAYNAIELGHRSLKAEMLQKIAIVLDVEPSIFFDQELHESCK